MPHPGALQVAEVVAVARAQLALHRQRREQRSSFPSPALQKRGGALQPERKSRGMAAAIFSPARRKRPTRLKTQPRIIVLNEMGDFDAETLAKALVAGGTNSAAQANHIAANSSGQMDEEHTERTLTVLRECHVYTLPPRPAAPAAPSSSSSRPGQEACPH